MFFLLGPYVYKYITRPAFYKVVIPTAVRFHLPRLEKKSFTNRKKDETERAVRLYNEYLEGG
ncbi:hypothetical protein CE91St62_15830 [Lachnospiraceae bacterium]|nr:hypothetical protein CE91St61_15930 [Lachnospiraceae bacterium]BDF37522.1 hypothetical protein CE91St62_15830 [Lachnospiraceae bacterium]